MAVTPNTGNIVVPLEKFNPLIPINHFLSRTNAWDHSPDSQISDLTQPYMNYLDGPAHEIHQRILRVHSELVDGNVDSMSRSLVIRHLLAHWAGKHNASLPIHRLPLELISEIFRLAACDEWAPRGAVQYSAVCRIWRQTCIDTVRCWTSIQIGNLYLAQLCLARSKQALIKINLEQGLRRVSRTDDGPVYVFDEMPTGAFQLLAENMYRVCALRVHVHTDSFARLFPILHTLSAPALVSLDMRDINPSIWTAGPDDLVLISESLGTSPWFSGTASSNLQHLSLFGLLPPSPGVYDRLVSLAIEVRDVFPTVDPLLQVLHGCQELVALSILVTVPLALGDDIHLTLPCLRHLSLELPAPEDAQCILECLSVPHLQRLAITLTRLEEEELEEEIEGLQEMVWHMPSAFRDTINSVRILTDAWRISVNGYTDSESITPDLEISLIWGSDENGLLQGLLDSLIPSLKKVQSVVFVERTPNVST